MTGPQDDDLFHLEEAPPTPATGRWGRAAVVGLVGALVVAVIAATVALRPEDPAVRPAASPDGVRSAGAAPAPTPATVVPVPAPAPATSEPVPAATTVVPTPEPPNPVKDTTTPMPPAERAAAEAELRAFVDAHLTSPVTLTSPLTWAGRDGTQSDPGEIATCPHLADRLASLLSGRWTYTYGSLPNHGGCTWTPVPWVPGADPAMRYFESVGFQPGVDVTSAEAHLRYQAAGTPCPEVDAPAVAPRAFAVRCQEPTALTYELVVPDAGGRGVWSLRTHAGHDQTGHTAQEGLIALVTAAQAAY